MRAISSLLGLLMIATMPAGALAQTPPPSSATPASAVPTTRILAIGTLLVSRDSPAFRPVMPAEVRATVNLYLNGKIDQWYVKQDQTGVVFILNVTTVEAAHAMLEALPLGKAKLMRFDLVPLGPLNPLRLLLKR